MVMSENVKLCPAAICKELIASLPVGNVNEYKRPCASLPA